MWKEPHWWWLNIDRDKNFFLVVSDVWAGPAEVREGWINPKREGLGVRQQVTSTQISRNLDFYRLCRWLMSLNISEMFWTDGRIDGAAADCTCNRWNGGSRPTESSNGFIFTCRPSVCSARATRWNSLIASRIQEKNIRETKNLQTSEDKEIMQPSTDNTYHHQVSGSSDAVDCRVVVN